MAVHADPGPSADAVPRPAAPLVLVVMGVAGSGKSTVAALLAGRLGWPFAEGDTLHPAQNVAKMAAGQPLTDADRAPWLERVADWVQARLDAGESGVITCSALRRAYRRTIDRRGHGVVFVHLAGSPDTIAARLAVRQGHFMPVGLLGSQFATLEEPGPDEPALRVEIAGSPEELVREITRRLGLPLPAPATTGTGGPAASERAPDPSAPIRNTVPDRAPAAPGAVDDGSRP